MFVKTTAIVYILTNQMSIYVPYVCANLQVITKTYIALNDCFHYSPTG